jgi:hypothetical protein
MSKPFEQWWHRTWEERFDELQNALGPANDLVTSFSWKDRIRVPGACAVTLPPQAREPHRRADWLYVSFGLSQPPNPEEVRERKAKRDFHSGRGYELAVLSADAAPWAPGALYDLLTRLTELRAAAPVSGDMIPFGRKLSRSARYLLLWPYRPRPLFITSTGRVDVLVATGVTDAERGLAQARSAAHLVLLLARCGVGQRTDLHRPCVTTDSSAMAAWHEIAELDNDLAMKNAMARV